MNMKKVLTVTLATFSAVTFISFGSEGRTSNSEDQVTICHYPPGNHANAHTITVGASAVQTHISQHGDTVGACAVSANNCDDCNYREADYEAGGCATTCGHLVK